MKPRMLLLAAMAVSLCENAQALEVSSSSIANGASLSIDQVKDGCGGKNISPALSWSGAPAATRSFAVTTFDPDAHGGWWHWVLLDIPATVQALPTGAGNGKGLPPGAVQGENDFGDLSYGGACPPPGSGQHHYEFTVWALPTETVPPGAKTEDIVSFLKTHAIAQAKLVAVYER